MQLVPWEFNEPCAFLYEEWEYKSAREPQRKFEFASHPSSPFSINSYCLVCISARMTNNFSAREKKPSYQHCPINNRETIQIYTRHEC